MRTWPIKFILFILFFFGLLFFKPFRTEVFAQSGPALGCSGWQADIALRGTSWHHRGTVIGVGTQVDAGFLNPSGSWEPATYIYYGEGALVSTGGIMYLNYTWWSEGAYLIRIYNSAGCYFDRRIYVAKSVESYGDNTVNNGQPTYSITRAGKEICGTLANYTQSVSATPVGGSAGFSMSSLGANYNLYRGQPGGDQGVPWMTTPLSAGASSSISNYSVSYKMAGVSTDTAGWTISPLNGATASWGINNLSLYLDCKPNKGSPPPVPTPACPTITSSCVGLTHSLSGIPIDSYYYLVYRDNGASSYWSNNKTFSTYTDATVPCGISHEYDVKPSYDNSTPLNDCQQNKTITCPCPTNTPIPPTSTPIPPTATPIQPTSTPIPTATPAPLCPACPASVILSGVARVGETDKYNVSTRWSASPNATGYKIYRCQGAGCAKPASALTSVGVGVTSYVDTNSNNGFDCVTNLSYWIEPTKAGCSEPGCARSNIILPACTPCVPACPVLGDPSSFYPPDAFRATSNSITLRWTISSWGTVCLPFVRRDHFTVYVSTKANDGNPAGTLNNSTGLLSGFSPQGKDVGVNTSETINNLVEGQWYYWQVKAENRD